jgi:hypothetical protein
MKPKIHLECCAIALGMVLPQLAFPQTPLISVDKVFDQFSSVSVWSSLAITKPGEAKFDNFFKGHEKPLLRYGFELGLGPYPLPSRDPLGDSLSKKIAQLEGDSLIRGELKKEEIEKLVYWRARRDTLTVKEKKREDAQFRLTVGLGLDNSNGYAFDTGLLNIKAPVRGYYLSVYLDKPGGISFCGLSVPYFCGLSGGFFDLSGATAYKDSSQYELASQTFSFELIPLGLYIGKSEDVRVTLELSWRYLVFEGIKYKRIEATSAAKGPSRLNFSGVQFTVGLEFGRKK